MMGMGMMNEPSFFSEMFEDMGPMGSMFQRRPRQQRNSMFGGFGQMSQAFFDLGSQQRPASRGGCTEEFINNLPPKDPKKETDCYICLEKCKEGAESV